MTTNRKRAQWADTCIQRFVALTGTDEPAEAIADLIADIGHSCDAKGLDFLHLVRTALGHWHMECTYPNDGDLMLGAPVVFITISESI